MSGGLRQPLAPLPGLTNAVLLQSLRAPDCHTNICSAELLPCRPVGGHCCGKNRVQKQEVSASQHSATSWQWVAHGLPMLRRTSSSYPVAKLDCCWAQEHITHCCARQVGGGSAGSLPLLPKAWLGSPTCCGMAHARGAVLAEGAVLCMRRALSLQTVIQGVGGACAMGRTGPRRAPLWLCVRGAGPQPVRHGGHADQAAALVGPTE